ncbi:hypothetical protein LUZ61_014601 [Rhynchospora tenuis]|uniref:Uncharacterized protein n=1 Tax=Rhynchospora tenuis TaxID=198213 RepID=A0AAD5WBB5_9POAL|nr:hypothetical protein LUZ61_014601 [Rhynchospora tenuis]
MCFQAKCGKCSKTTWQGCGRHVASVYKQIPQGQHCMCKDWPGVVIEKKETEGGDSSGQTGGDSTKTAEPETSNCSVL